MFLTAARFQPGRMLGNTADDLLTAAAIILSVGLTKFAVRGWYSITPRHYTKKNVLDTAINLKGECWPVW